MTSRMNSPSTVRPKTATKPVKTAKKKGAEPEVLPPLIDLESMRRSVSARYLRWQGKFDTDVADRWVPWVAWAVLFAALVTLAFGRHQALDSGSTIAEYLQAAWFIRQGQPPQLTIIETHMLAVQLSWIMYPVAQLTRLASPWAVLLTLQSLALSAGVVPLWRVSREVARLRAGGALALVTAYALFPAVHNLNLADFHPEALAVPFLLGCFRYGLRERWIPFGICAAIAVSCRADLGLAVAGIGIVIALEKNRRAGTITIIAGVAYSALAVFVLQPFFANGNEVHVNAFAVFGDTPVEVLRGMITHPFTAISELFREGNFQALVVLLAPVAFLPIIAPRYLMPLVPLQALYLMADVGTAETAQQFVPGIAFVFVAAGAVLARTGRAGVTRIMVDRRLLGAVLLAAAVFFVRDSASSPYRDPWAWDRDALDLERADIVVNIDFVDLLDGSEQPAMRTEFERSIMASESLLAELGERDFVYRVRTLPARNGSPSILLPSPAPAFVAIDATAFANPDRDRARWRNSLDDKVFTDLNGAELTYRLERTPGANIDLYKLEAAGPEA